MKTKTLFTITSLASFCGKIGLISAVLLTACSVYAGDVMVPASFIAKAKACGGEICQIEDTKSMEPALNARCLVIVRPAKFSEIKRDDIVVFNRNGKVLRTGPLIQNPEAGLRKATIALHATSRF